MYEEEDMVNWYYNPDDCETPTDEYSPYGQQDVQDIDYDEVPMI